MPLSLCSPCRRTDTDKGADSGGVAAAAAATSNGGKLARCRARLRLQVRQTNHLRLKLGYTLAELRLYKRLKAELDERLSVLQDGLQSSQQQQSQCLQRLQLVEQLGSSGR